MKEECVETEKVAMDSLNLKYNRSVITYRETGDLLADTCEIVESAQRIAYVAVDTILVQRNWLLGKRIAIECLNGNGKADYGKKTMKKLSAELREKYGKGFDFSSLYKYVKFHQEFPQILDSLSPKSGRPLSWTHYRILLQETSSEARAWYEKEAQEQSWSVRTLQRNVSSQYYYIDLVFYNYILKCFVLIDLKTSKITHQDVGQMDMYIRMYDEMKRNEGDNPTLGIILCSDTDEDIAKYSILHGHEQLFASKYKTCLPSEEQLREEIETQNRFYYLQKKEDMESKEDI